MGFFFFVVGVLVGTLLLVLLPLFIAVVGVIVAIGIVIALPVIVAVLILFGIIAVAPAIGYGLAIAAILIALWLSDAQRSSSDGSCRVVSCPRTGSAMASSRLRAPFHSLGGRTCPSLPIWSMPQ